MKKLILAATAMAGLMAGGALAASITTQDRVSQSEVDRAIDSRLHAMLVKLNAEKK